MKRFLVSLLLTVSLFVPSAMASHDIRLGLNLVNSVSGAGDADIDFPSPVFFWDSYFNLTSQFGLGTGIGFMYQTTSDRDFAWMYTDWEEDCSASTYIMPVYLSARYEFNLDGSSLKPYAKLNLGYAFWWADEGIVKPVSGSGYSVYDSWTEGGFYWGLSAGVRYGILVLELNYATFTGTIATDYRYYGEFWRYRPEVDFNFLNLSVGIAF